MRIVYSDNLKRIPPYLFAELERKVEEMRMKGDTVYDLSIGDPDLPTPPEIVKVLQKAAMDKRYQGYSSSRGERFFREAVAEWYRKRFSVNIDPDKEVCALIGSKEGLANIARAFINIGDTVLVPDPGYPVYSNGAALLSYGDPAPLPLLAERGYLPDLDEINPFRAKLMYLNYPNNPTGAIAPKKFLSEAVAFARDHDIILCYDNAYSEMVLEGEQACSILEVPGAMDCCVEFNSCSKTFNMTGSRIGFAVGSERIISALAKVKSQIDSGAPPFVQVAAAYALSLYKGKEPPAVVRRNVEIYKRRMKLFAEGLRECGLDCAPSPATFYLWVRVGGSSMEYANWLLKRGIVATPGIGFGLHGEGYIRFALTKDETVLAEAISRLKRGERESAD